MGAHPDSIAIHFVRHGRPTLRYTHTPLRWITAGELNRLLDAYDDAGLDPDWNRGHLPVVRATHSPVDWQAITRAHGIASDLPRAFETALLFSGRPPAAIATSQLFRETPVARFRWTGLRLPTFALLTMVRIGWFTGWMRCLETRRDSLARVRAAANHLEDAAARHGAVTLYSHGFFLWLLSRELRQRGWVSAKSGPFRYLECAIFRRAPAV